MVSEPERTALGRIARGAAHTLGSTYAGRLVNWVATFILMRQLRPEDFGHIALAATILALVIAVRNPGLHNALLHQYRRVDDLAFTHFVLNIGLSTVGVLAAVGLAILYVDERCGRHVAVALSVFAGFDLLRSAVQTAETQLRRDLAFSHLAGAHAAALVLAAVTGVVAVYAGAGVWALILSHSVHGVAYVTSYCVLVWRKQPPQFTKGRRFDRDGAHSMMRYGSWFWGGGIMRTLQLQFDRLVVFAVTETGQLGIYAQAHYFAQLPTGAVTHALSNIGVAVYARYQEDRKLLSGAYRRSLRLVMRATVPLNVIIAVEMPAITRLLVGEDWLPIVPVVRCLLLFSLCRPVVDTAQALLRSVGDPRGIFWFELVQAILLVVAAPLLTLQLGVRGTALAMGLMALVGVVLAVRRTGRYADVPALSTFGPALLAASVAAGIRVSLGGFFDSLQIAAALPLGIGVFAAAYCTALLAVERQMLLKELGTLWNALTATGQSPTSDRQDA